MRLGRRAALSACGARAPARRRRTPQSRWTRADGPPAKRVQGVVDPRTTANVQVIMQVSRQLATRQAVAIVDKACNQLQPRGQRAAWKAAVGERSQQRAASTRAPAAVKWTAHRRAG